MKHLFQLQSRGKNKFIYRENSDSDYSADKQSGEISENTEPDTAETIKHAENTENAEKAFDGQSENVCKDIDGQLDPRQKNISTYVRDTVSPDVINKLLNDNPSFTGEDIEGCMNAFDGEVMDNYWRRDRPAIVEHSLKLLSTQKIDVNNFERYVESFSWMGLDRNNGEAIEYVFDEIEPLLISGESSSTIDSLCNFHESMRPFHGESRLNWLNTIKKMAENSLSVESFGADFKFLSDMKRGSEGNVLSLRYLVSQLLNEKVSSEDFQSKLSEAKEIVFSKEGVERDIAASLVNRKDINKEDVSDFLSFVKTIDNSNGSENFSDLVRSIISRTHELSLEEVKNLLSNISNSAKESGDAKIFYNFLWIGNLGTIDKLSASLVKLVQFSSTLDNHSRLYFNDWVDNKLFSSKGPDFSHDDLQHLLKTALEEKDVMKTRFYDRFIPRVLKYGVEGGLDGAGMSEVLTGIGTSFKSIKETLGVSPLGLIDEMLKIDIEGAKACLDKFEAVGLMGKGDVFRLYDHAAATLMSNRDSWTEEEMESGFKILLAAASSLEKEIPHNFEQLFAVHDREYKIDNLAKLWNSNEHKDLQLIKKGFTEAGIDLKCFKTLDERGE